MISTRVRGRTPAERLAAKKLRQQQRKAKSAGAPEVAGGQAGAAAMLPVPHFDSFGRVVSPSASAR